MVLVFIRVGVTPCSSRWRRPINASTDDTRTSFAMVIETATLPPAGSGRHGLSYLPTLPSSYARPLCRLCRPPPRRLSEFGEKRLRWARWQGQRNGKVRPRKRPDTAMALDSAHAGGTSTTDGWSTGGWACLAGGTQGCTNVGEQTGGAYLYHLRLSDRLSGIQRKRCSDPSRLYVNQQVCFLRPAAQFLGVAAIYALTPATGDVAP